MHKLILIGNLGQDPEMRYTPAGDSVTTFSVASSRKINLENGQSKEETEWFNCSVWGKLGETCNQYLTKGSKVYIEGGFKVRSYENRAGQTAFSLDVRVQQVQFLSPGKQSPVAAESPGAADSEYLPF